MWSPRGGLSSATTKDPVSSISSRFSLLAGTDSHLLHSLLASKPQGCAFLTAWLHKTSSQQSIPVDKGVHPTHSNSLQSAIKSQAGSPADESFGELRRLTQN